VRALRDVPAGHSTDFDRINEAALDAESGATIKPVLRMT
jgi:hypothetical protein